MKTIKEIAESYANWILRREGALKSAQLPRVLEGMLKEQREADIEKACKWMEENLGYYNRNEVHIGKSYEQCVIGDFLKAMEE